MNKMRTIFVFLLATAAVAICQSDSTAKSQKPNDNSRPPAEDISGMYSFVNEGEFLQIDIENGKVSGYISRGGDLESDRGTFLDQFFDKASVSGHDVTFITKIVHGEWFEFQGYFERGRGKSKADDGYYILKGTLTQFTSSEGQRPTSRVRSVEFKFLGQPEDVEEKKTRPKPK